MKKIPDDLKSLEERIKNKERLKKPRGKTVRNQSLPMRPKPDSGSEPNWFRAYWSGPLWATFWTNCSTRSPFCSLFACFSAVPRDS